MKRLLTLLPAAIICVSAATAATTDIHELYYGPSTEATGALVNTDNFFDYGDLPLVRDIHSIVTLSGETVTTTANVAYGVWTFTKNDCISFVTERESTVHVYLSNSYLHGVLLDDLNLKTLDGGRCVFTDERFSGNLFCARIDGVAPGAHIVRIPAEPNYTTRIIYVGVQYTAAAESTEIATPDHGLEVEDGDVLCFDSPQVIEFATAQEHHRVYVHFASAAALVQPLSQTDDTAADEAGSSESVTMTHDEAQGKTFHLAEGNRYTVGQSGTLSYFSYDPVTGGKSSVGTLEFDITTGIGTISAGPSEETPAEYFNLQGIRTATPTPGEVYIRRLNGVSKLVIMK